MGGFKGRTVGFESALDVASADVELFDEISGFFVEVAEEDAKSHQKEENNHAADDDLEERSVAKEMGFGGSGFDGVV